MASGPRKTIGQFWAITIVQGATNWLSGGAIGFGAIGVALAALVLGDRGLSLVWRWSFSAAGLLVPGGFAAVVGAVAGGEDDRWGQEFAGAPVLEHAGCVVERDHCYRAWRADTTGTLIGCSIRGVPV